MSDIWLIRSTFAKKDEAISISRTLLEAKLIACANIDEGITSLFRWEGMVHQEQEVVMIAKTTQGKLEAAIAHIKAHHSYQLPAITAWPVGAVEPAFAAWIAHEVS